LYLKSQTMEKVFLGWPKGTRPIQKVLQQQEATELLKFPGANLGLNFDIGKL
jgi:hypothetical protein